ncbi:uncharacterized protein LOC132747121 [Ruditapes philippinarum]|uniref:uncharacterized protein LOC132747121 n=1 Tax=Ruditapes philippinarum TaxID=129788 RepID=UPI00295C2589|nr:uncharacterized protein LOC132747121 [Ruditapes philippinarum]
MQHGNSSAFFADVSPSATYVIDKDRGQLSQNGFLTLFYEHNHDSLPLMRTTRDIKGQILPNNTPCSSLSTLKQLPILQICRHRGVESCPKHDCFLRVYHHRDSRRIDTSLDQLPQCLPSPSLLQLSQLLCNMATLQLSLQMCP